MPGFDSIVRAFASLGHDLEMLGIASVAKCVLEVAGLSLLEAHEVWVNGVLPCICVLCVKEKEGKRRSGVDTEYLLIYMDDVVLTATSTALLHKIIFSLHNEFDMTDLGSCLRAHMLNCNPTRTPVDTESKLEPEGTPISDLTLYQSLAGSSLVAYSDVDWAGFSATHRSTFGYCVFLRNTLLSWSFKRQHTLLRSSVEVEYQGVANVVVKTTWLRNLLQELNTPLLTAILVYCNNISIVYLSTNLVQHQRTKHADIELHFVCDIVATDHVRVLHVLFCYQYVDIPKVFLRHYLKIIALV
nr:ribonuclease H-like domain-containing protein [Tanacetum cinerariifolium]